MFRKILLALDLTDKHAAAVRCAADLARPGQGTVLLLHVVELIPGLERAEEKDFYDRLEKMARAHLGRTAADLAREKIACHSHVIFGSRAQATVGFAAEHGVDLIVLTSPAFHPQHPASSLGSMAWKISLVAPCPVLLVKADAQA